MVLLSTLTSQQPRQADQATREHWTKAPSQGSSQTSLSQWCRPAVYHLGILRPFTFCTFNLHCSFLPWPSSLRHRSTLSHLGNEGAAHSRQQHNGRTTTTCMVTVAAIYRRLRDTRKGTRATAGSRIQPIFLLDRHTFLPLALQLPLNPSTC